MSRLQDNFKVHVSATFFKIPGKDQSVAAANSTQCFNKKFNIKVDCLTTYLSDVTVNMRKRQHGSLESLMKSRSVTKEIKNRRPQKSFTFECRCLTRDLVSKVISDANIPFSLDRIQWTENQKDWIPLKNSDDIIGCVLDITNRMEIISPVYDTKRQEFTLLLSITKETIVPLHEFERMVRQTKVEQLARDASRMVSLMSQHEASFGRPLSRTAWESTILGPVRERGAALGIDSLESLIDLAISLLGEQEGSELVRPALKSSVEALREAKVGDHDEITVCAICREDMDIGCQVKSMPCRHRFHNTCIEMWLGWSHVCPLCRFRLPTGAEK